MIHIIDTIEPLGNFFAVKAKHVGVGESSLDEVLNATAIELSKKASKEYVDTQIANIPKGDVTKEYVDNNFAKKSDIPTVPTKTSQLQNDSGYVKKTEMPTKVSAFQNDAEYLTQHQSLTNYAKKSDIPTVPTNVSAFVNDSGYLTEHQDISYKADAVDVAELTGRVSATETEQTALSARMDNIVTREPLPDDDVADAHIGIDGTNYTSLGGAIRTQISDLKGNMYQQATAYNPVANGSYTPSGLSNNVPNRLRTALIPVNKGDEITVDANLEHIFGAWDGEVLPSKCYKNETVYRSEKETFKVLHDGYFVAVFRKPTDESVSISDYTGTITKSILGISKNRTDIDEIKLELKETNDNVIDLKTAVVRFESGAFNDNGDWSKRVLVTRIRTVNPLWRDTYNSITIPAGYDAYLVYRDINGNFISFSSYLKGKKFLDDTPETCKWIDIVVRNPVTPNGDISNQVYTVQNGFSYITNAQHEVNKLKANHSDVPAAISSEDFTLYDCTAGYVNGVYTVKPTGSNRYGAINHRANSITVKVGNGTTVNSVAITGKQYTFIAYSILERKFFRRGNNKDWPEIPITPLSVRDGMPDNFYCTLAYNNDYSKISIVISDIDTLKPVASYTVDVASYFDAAGIADIQAYHGMGFSSTSADGIEITNCVSLDAVTVPKAVDKYATIYTAEEDALYNKVIADIDENTMVFTCVTDTHYAENRWYNSLPLARITRKISENIGVDFVMHMGDMIYDDDVNPNPNDNIRRIKEYTEENRKSYIPFMYALGHHEMYPWIDENNYAVNQYKVLGLCGRYNRYISPVFDPNNHANYYFDHRAGIRVIVVDTNYKKWGVTEETIQWVRQTALSTDNKIIFVSHAQFDHASSGGDYEIYNGDWLQDVIMEFASDKVIAHLHGHTHFDNIRTSEKGLTEIAFLCGAPLRDTSAALPDGAVTYPRSLRNYNEYAFDIVCVHSDTGKINMYRFGAGVDRSYTPQSI